MTESVDNVESPSKVLRSTSLSDVKNIPESNFESQKGLVKTKSMINTNPQDFVVIDGKPIRVKRSISTTSNITGISFDSLEDSTKHSFDEDVNNTSLLKKALENSELIIQKQNRLIIHQAKQIEELEQFIRDLNLSPEKCKQLDKLRSTSTKKIPNEKGSGSIQESFPLESQLCNKYELESEQYSDNYPEDSFNYITPKNYNSGVFFPSSDENSNKSHKTASSVQTYFSTYAGDDELGTTGGGTSELHQESFQSTNNSPYEHSDLSLSHNGSVNQINESSLLTKKSTKKPNASTRGLMARLALDPKERRKLRQSKEESKDPMDESVRSSRTLNPQTFSSKLNRKSTADRSQDLSKSLPNSLQNIPGFHFDTSSNSTSPAGSRCSSPRPMFQWKPIDSDSFHVPYLFVAHDNPQLSKTIAAKIKPTLLTNGSTKGSSSSKAPKVSKTTSFNSSISNPVSGMDVMFESKAENDITHFLLGKIVYSGDFQHIEEAELEEVRGSECLVVHITAAIKGPIKSFATRVQNDILELNLKDVPPESKVAIQSIEDVFGFFRPCQSRVDVILEPYHSNSYTWFPYWEGHRKMAPQFRSQGIGYIRLGDDMSRYGTAFISMDAGKTYLDGGKTDILANSSLKAPKYPPPLVRENSQGSTVSSVSFSTGGFDSAQSSPRGSSARSRPSNIRNMVMNSRSNGTDASSRAPVLSDDEIPSLSSPSNNTYSKIKPTSINGKTKSLSRASSFQSNDVSESAIDSVPSSSFQSVIEDIKPLVEELKATTLKWHDRVQVLQALEQKLQSLQKMAHLTAYFSKASSQFSDLLSCLNDLLLKQKNPNVLVASIKCIKAMAFEDLLVRSCWLPYRALLISAIQMLRNNNKLIYEAAMDALTTLNVAGALSLNLVVDLMGDIYLGPGASSSIKKQPVLSGESNTSGVHEKKDARIQRTPPTLKTSDSKRLQTAANSSKVLAWIDKLVHLHIEKKTKQFAFLALQEEILLRPQLNPSPLPVLDVCAAGGHIDTYSALSTTLILLQHREEATRVAASSLISGFIVIDALQTVPQDFSNLLELSKRVSGSSTQVSPSQIQEKLPCQEPSFDINFAQLQTVLSQALSHDLSSLLRAQFDPNVTSSSAIVDATEREASPSGVSFPRSYKKIVNFAAHLLSRTALNAAVMAASLKANPIEASSIHRSLGFIELSNEPTANQSSPSTSAVSNPPNLEIYHQGEEDKKSNPLSIKESVGLLKSRGRKSRRPSMDSNNENINLSNAPQQEGMEDGVFYDPSVGDRSPTNIHNNLESLRSQWNDLSLLLKKVPTTESESSHLISVIKEAERQFQALFRLAEDYQIPVGSLLRVLLPFNENTSSADQTVHQFSTQSLSSKEQDEAFASNLSELIQLYHLPTNLLSAQRDLKKLNAFAVELRRLIRVKMSDEADLKQAIDASKMLSDFILQLESLAQSTHMEMGQIIVQLNS